MDCSFAPNGRWFVFDADTGKTLVKDLSSKPQAIRWMAKELARRAEAEQAKAA